VRRCMLHVDCMCCCCWHVWLCNVASLLTTMVGGGRRTQHKHLMVRCCRGLVQEAMFIHCAPTESCLR
jgi:hypothetical protein